MPVFRFIHCSDLHLDAPFSGLADSRPELGRILRDAALQAFDNVIGLAIRERVDAVLIAGDVYDSADKSLRAQLKFRTGLARLSDAGIASFVAHGNHDPLDAWSASIEWPERATLFPGDRVAAVPVKRGNEILATVYGISYPRRDIMENLALRFKKEPGGGFAVGVLHANVGAQPGHDNYAPCKMDDLLSGGMDYWALGHIHARQILRKAFPAVAYCGNPQARSIKESGEKGCLLVALADNRAPEIQFMATDVARFQTLSLDVSDCENLDQAIRLASGECARASSQAEGRSALLRVRLTGRTPIHQELARSGAAEDLAEELNARFAGRSPGIWIDLEIETRGRYELESLRLGNDFFADMMSLYDDASAENLAKARSALEPLFEDWQGQRFLDGVSDEELRGLLLKARDLTLDRLVEDI